jgi:translocator protein
MMNPRLLVVLQAIAFIAMITVNALANILPINGLNTGQVSALYNNLFVPAGFTFSIWGVIYLLLLFWVVASGMILWTGANKNRLYAHALTTAPLFLLTCILNACWIFCWHYLQISFSLIVMLCLLITLTGIYRKMQQHRIIIAGMHWWILYLPFVIYLSWICVATIANTTALLVHIQWNAFGMAPWLWSCIMIAVTFLLPAAFAFWRGELAFACVTAWALFGIYKAQLLVNENVGFTALSAAVLCLVVGVLGFAKRNRKMPLERIV